MDADELICKRFDVYRKGEYLPYAGRIESNRETLALLFAELGYKVGAEIGVDRGINAEMMLNRIPNLKLFCIDRWPLPKHYEEGLKRLSNLNVELMKEDSLVAVRHIARGTLDFIHFDAGRDFDFLMLNLILWERKVRVGGIISGQGYCNFYQGGVIQAVDAYTKAHNINPWYITNEHQPTFFWVKK